MKNFKNIFTTKTLITCLTLIAMFTVASVSFFAGEAPAFKDVPATHWGYNSIQRAYTDGAVSGSSYDEAAGARYYSPEAELTMAEFTTILTRAFYADELAASTAGNDPWYAATQDVCEKRGITKGFSFFDANYASSRYQMATIIYNILVDKGVNMPSQTELTAAQSKIGDWDRISEERYRTPIATVVAMGIITGKDANGNFVGADSVTRAEAATIYCRVADVISTNGSVAKPEQPEKPETPVTPEKPEPKPETPEQPATGNYGPVGTLSDTPVTLSLSTHKPVVDYWSKASADVQAITDKDAFNAAVQTMKDRDLQVFESSRSVINNEYYNYAVFVDDRNGQKQLNVSYGVTLMNGYGSYGIGHSPKNADSNNLGVFTFVHSTNLKNQYDLIFAPIFSQFRSGMTDRQKAEIMIKAVTDRFDYGVGTFDWLSDNRVGDCNNFANSVKVIFNAAGIPTFNVDGTMPAGAHMWDMAYLDGTWYMIDATAAEVGFGGIFTVAEHENVYHYTYSGDSDEYKVAKALVNAAYNQ